jgi:hypothetical protein
VGILFVYRIKKVYVLSTILLGWVEQPINIGFSIPLCPVEESLEVHDAGPYYVFTADVHIRYDMRVLAAEAATKKTDATSTRRTYPRIQR